MAIGYPDGGESMLSSSVQPVSRAVLSKRWAGRARGTLSIILLVPFAAAALLAQPHFTHAVLAKTTFIALGWVCFMVGAAFRLWATLYIGGRKGSQLTDQGPYSICRNPLYLGTFFMTVSIGFFVQSLTFFIGTMAATCFYLAVTVPEEEGRLRGKHGATYDAYCRRVPRFIPRLAGFSTAGQISVDVRCLGIEAVRAARWAWIPVACQALLIAREQLWWPHWFLLP